MHELFFLFEIIYALTHIVSYKERQYLIFLKQTFHFF